MDPAVALAQAYLQLNGYLTVTEFPITTGSGVDARAVTDVDVIALRFPGALAMGMHQEARPDTDPRLAIDGGVMDLLICEVKEGKARLNPNLTRRDTLTRTLRRVGCCPEDHVGHHVDGLLRLGVAEMEHRGVRCRARLAVFAGRVGYPRHTLVVSLAHAAREVCRYLRAHEPELHATQYSQPSLSHLSLLMKLGVLPTPDPARGG